MHRALLLFLNAFLIGILVAGSPVAQAEEPTQNGPSVAAIRRMPHVHSVKVRPARGEPTVRIIHILDWHYLPQDLFAADLRTVATAPIDDAEIAKRYRKFLRDVEQVQKQQMVILRRFNAKHAVRKVFLEGLTDDRLPAFRKQVAVLRRFEKQKPRGDTPIEQFLLEQYQNDLLKIGSPGRVMLAGKLDVRAAEEKAAFDAANPIGKDGRVRIDMKSNERRESAIAKRLVTSGAVAVIVLGGGHDLSDNLPTTCEYVRVAVKAYAKSSETNR